MNTQKRHIAQSGPNAGKYVPCPAQHKCRISSNSGHIDETTAKLLESEYGEATQTSYIQYLENKLQQTLEPTPPVPNTKPATVTNTPTFFKSQKSLDRWLENNEVKASVKISGIERRSLYSIDNINYCIKDFQINNSLTSTSLEEAENNIEKASKRLRKDNRTWTVSPKGAQLLFSAVNSPYSSEKIKKHLEICVDCLEDGNFHSFQAYIEAVWNLNRTSKVKD